ncbi:MAG TPA: ribosomal protein S18-alanine N-acetyltransferase [Xanthobacteraceae bacterium]|nr:ribosomal protein S18-alanine N-acetyltransferase [Xanthobacteraceae bacterium]
MTSLFQRLLKRTEPALSEASRRDAAAMSHLHMASFRRGWTDGEFERLLIDRAVIAHRATIGRKLVGFIISRMAAAEAEILSVAVDTSYQGRGIGAALLRLHLRRLTALGSRSVFLEVDEHNEPARRLYANAGFREVGRRAGYYPQDGTPRAALVLRRDLVE